ncbi:MAG: lysine--tRNA ligase [Acidimicrobiales bacterium]
MSDDTTARKRRPKGSKPDWPTQIADRVLRRHERDLAGSGDSSGKKAGVVIASGLSPSGPIHLGNLRELLVPHFVAEEVRRRGVPCEHVLSWDDYDRLRKVPAGVPESFATHIGRPLTAVPDPWGDVASYAERFKAPVRTAMAELGVEIREISQTEMYTSGAYRDQVLLAIDRRHDIDGVLQRFRTLEEGAAATVAENDDDGEEVLEAGGAEDDPVATGTDYWPYKVYCQACGRDLTEITDVERTDDRCLVSYRCAECDHSGSFDLMVENHGKLVWKVDWPMRWAYEGVTFEAAGADHSSPGSSFSVGAELVSIFGGEAPEYEAYSFVGIRGMGKLSSSRGAVPTPGDALSILEPGILRWMYVRKTPRQGITVDLGAGIHALYDEWDSLGRKVGTGDANPSQTLTYDRARRTSIVEKFPAPAAVVPFRTLASAVSVGAGDDTQIARIVGELTDLDASNIADAEPRLGHAKAWLDGFASDEERITVRDEPDIERLGELSEQEQAWLDLLLGHLDDDWSLEGARTLAYGVPKLADGLPLDTPPTDELKRQQREFFKLLYQLVLSAETGPRMPTLLMALGQDRIRSLLATTG